MSAMVRTLAVGTGGWSWRTARFAVGAALAMVGLALMLADLTRTVIGSTVLTAALSGGMVAGAATALGALPVLLMRRRISAGTEDAMLGFGAGVMLAASAFSLVIPAVAAGTEIVGSRGLAALLAAVSLAAGVVAMFAVERAVPHTHGDVPAVGGSGIRAVWLMVFAILIHNFPEGLAIGAAFSGGASGWPVALAIAIQDVPEGLVVALALRSVGHGAGKAAGIGALTGLAEPVGAVASALVVSAAPALYPMALAAAAGAMLFVVSHEIIPGTHRRGHESAATMGVALGFAVMMVLDNAFGG